MNRRFLTFGILIVILVGVFVPTSVVYAEEGVFNWIFGSLADSLFKGVGYILMTLSGLVLTIVGMLFDKVMEYTVLDMGKNLSDPNGIGGSISTAWSTLRDVANMVFIFVLLYAAFKTMFDTNFGNFQTTVKNIIIVALLINFSLFFSKVVIDASNIVAVGFYRSISSTSSLSVATVTSTSTPTSFSGISAGYMNLLGLQNFYSTNILTNRNLDTAQIIITGIMSSVFMLVAAVILLMSGIMFVARFIILIFLMILSPLALIAYIIPGQKGQFTKWREALVDQSFFAPLFFALTWVSFKLASAPNFLGSLQKTDDYTQIVTKLDTSAAALILNYVLVIGLAIAALVISKTMATRGATAAVFKGISGGIGTAAMGGVGLAGRQTVGRYANKVAGDKGLQERAARGDVGARMKLATAQKLAGSSFDVRGIADTKVGKFVGAGQVMDIAGRAKGTGGFKSAIDTKTENRRKRTDEVMKRFRNQPEILADHLESLSSGDQKYMYDELSVRDRAAVDDVLDKKYGTTGGNNPVTTRLRAGLSPEEKEKTEKAGKEAVKEEKSKQFLDEIDNLVHGRAAAVPGSRTTTTPAGIPATYDDLLVGPNKLKATDARKLSLDALNEEEVVKRLTVKHLSDIINNKDDLDDATTGYIVSVIDMAPYSPHLAALQTKQHQYIHGTAKDLWGVP